MDTLRKAQGVEEGDVKMISKMIEGATRIIGKSQGYLGLAVRDQFANCTVNGDGTPEMATAWEPTPDELAALNAGAAVHVRLLGTAHPPILVEVGPLPDAGPTPGATP